MYSRSLSLVAAYTLANVLCMADGAAAAAPAKRIRLKPATKALLLSMKDATDTNPFLIEDRTAQEVVDLLKVKPVPIFFNETSAKGNSVMAILSPDGKELAAKYTKTEPENPRGPLPKPEDFELEDDIEIPTGRATVVRTVYPFEKMNVGQSFFIEPTEQSPEPWKSKQSSVNAQNRKCALAFEERKAAGQVTEGELPPKWKIWEDTKNGVKGARVGRFQ